MHPRGMNDEVLRCERCRGVVPGLWCEVDRRPDSRKVCQGCYRELNGWVAPGGDRGREGCLGGGGRRMVKDSVYIPPTLARLLDLGTELDGLGRAGAPFRTDTRDRPMILAQVPAVWATARHSITTGKAALDLYAEGRQLVALTLIRSALEAAITAQWLVQSNESIPGFIGEDYRQRRNIAKGMAGSGSALMREGALKVAHIADEDIETVAANEARHFERRCLTLKRGKDAYVDYRILSGMVHPSPTLADFTSSLTMEYRLDATC